jgi:hypothetical protein
MKRLVVVLGLPAQAASGVFAQSSSAGGPGSPAPPAAGRAEVLVLGVYHMANPGRDLFNMKADDVLAPKRQAEIAELVDVLKRFQPTKVALEADVWDERVGQRYADYVAGRHELSRNETEQVGFRLAKEMGHEKVYPVDVDGDRRAGRLGGAPTSLRTGSGGTCGSTRTSPLSPLPRTSG